MIKRMLIVLVACLMLSCTLFNEPDVSATASLLLYSGMPDPTWELTRKQSREFVSRLNGLTAEAAGEEPSFLGYRGIGVMLMQGETLAYISVANGKAVVRTDSTEKWYTDSGRGLERWLLETGKPHLKTAEYDLALGSFSTGFAIYLLDNPQPQQGMGPAEPESLDIETGRQNEAFITEKDIVSYRPASYELTLTEEAYKRYDAMVIPVRGLRFAVVVGDDVIYTGTFCTPISSLSNEGIVIEKWLPGGDSILRFQLGYPESPDLFVGEDLRNAEEILTALRNAGKLLDQ